MGSAKAVSSEARSPLHGPQYEGPSPNHGDTGTRPARLCPASGFAVVEEYRDEGINGAKDSRPALDRLMKDARARKFDVVIVARFDRFARPLGGARLLKASR
jgi:Resolvase, N terminal domain